MIEIAEQAIHYTEAGSGEALLVLPDHLQMAGRGGYALPDFVLNAIRCPALLTGSLQDPLTPGLAEPIARISRIVPDCTGSLAST